MVELTPLFALLTGLSVGVLFALLDFPIPATRALSGILGFVGIYLGYKVVEVIIPLVS
ncbi:XapX domain-containing protein [archaeon SCG-AAA382B04]|nr:XapX domain-containing protein [archaeon SCG-AAA382B04]